MKNPLNSNFNPTQLYMKLINSTFHIMEQNPGINGVFEMITKAGYTCYKTEKVITEDSAERFVERMKNSGHGAMLEHGTVYLIMEWDTTDTSESVGSIKYLKNPYSKVYYRRSPGNNLVTAYITTNYRVLWENHWLKDLQYMSNPTEYHFKRYTVRFITDRGVSHEIVRHRVMSFAQESTRYCNYSQDKFGNELTFIKPSWIDNEFAMEVFTKHLEDCEEAYFTLLNTWENRKPDRRYKTEFKGNPLTPQQARQVLPNAIKTEIVVTGFVTDWLHFFDLRAKGTTGAPHPDMKALAEPLYYEFIRRGYIHQEKGA